VSSSGPSSSISSQSSSGVSAVLGELGLYLLLPFVERGEAGAQSFSRSTSTRIGTPMFIAWMPRVAASSRTSVIYASVAPAASVALTCCRTPGRYMCVAFASTAM
jgi:hypothetical protein